MRVLFVGSQNSLPTLILDLADLFCDYFLLLPIFFCKDDPLPFGAISFEHVFSGGIQILIRCTLSVRDGSFLGNFMVVSVLSYLSVFSRSLLLYP